MFYALFVCGQYVYNTGLSKSVVFYLLFLGTGCLSVFYKEKYGPEKLRIRKFIYAVDNYVPQIEETHFDETVFLHMKIISPKYLTLNTPCDLKPQYRGFLLFS